MTNIRTNFFVFTLFDATCVFSDDRRCVESKNSSNTRLLRIYNGEGSVAINNKVGFTNPIQIFTVPYSFMDVVLLDCALSQPKLLKETVNEKVALRS